MVLFNFRWLLQFYLFAIYLASSAYATNKYFNHVALFLLGLPNIALLELVESPRIF